jgi:protein-S-isoprenylcysteine O-methyltransferase Ste14
MEGFRAKGGWWVVAQALLLAALTASWLLWGGDWGVAALAAGAVLAGAGAALAGSGLLVLGRHLSPYPTPRHDAALVEHGPYRLARHPIYGGIILGAAGLSVADGNWPGLALSALLAVLFWAKSEFEERRLFAHFPAYAGYRERVRRRLIPWVL